MRLGIALREGVRFQDPSEPIAALDAWAGGERVYPHYFPIWRSLSDPGRRAVPRSLLTDLIDRGVTPVVFLETVAADEHWGEYGYEAIAGRRIDTAICEFANSLHAEAEVIVRIDQEMNVGGLGAPWQERDPREFKTAWRRLAYSIWTHASNARVAWCPQVTNPDQAMSADGYYPGKGWVDYVGFDRFDRGALRPLPKAWQKPVEFLSEIAPGKPRMVFEFGCVHTGDPALGTGRSAWLKTIDGVPDTSVVGAIYLDMDVTPDDLWTMSPAMRRTAQRIIREENGR